MGRKAKSDRPLTPLRVRVHPRILERYAAVAAEKGVPTADLKRAALERMADEPQTLEQLAEDLKR